MVPKLHFTYCVFLPESPNNGNDDSATKNQCLKGASDSGPVVFFVVVVVVVFNLFIYGCVGSSFLCEGPPHLRQAGATPHRSARASHHRGLSCCGTQAPDAQAQQLWLTGPAALRHAGSSQTRARTRVPRIGRQTLNHCATREARACCFELQGSIQNLPLH